MEIRNTMDAETLQQTKAMLKIAIPLGGDLRKVENFPPIMIYLTSDSAKFVTGQILAVNGGFTMVRG